MSEENTVTIPEVEETQSQDVVDGFTEQEKALAERVKFKIEENKEEKKESEDGVQNEKKDEQAKKPVDEKKVIVEDDYDSFDKVHDLYENDKDRFYSLPKAIKNHYHNSKGLYKKFKDEEEKRKRLEEDSGFNRLQESVSKNKIERIAKRIAQAKQSPDLNGLTIEEIEELLDYEIKKDDSDDKPLTRKDLERIREEESNKKNQEQNNFEENRKRVAGRIQESEVYAKQNISDLTGNVYKDFTEVVTLAHEMAEKKPRFAKMIGEALNGDDSIEDLVDTIIDIAKSNPKWGGSVKKTEMVDVERMEKNAQRQKTSASVTGGKGGRVISWDDMTPEDAVKLPRSEWTKMPAEVRRRILSQV